MKIKGDFENKISLVTGSSKGIGREVAKEFALNGARVIINYPDDSERKNAKNAVSEILSLGGEAIAIQADVSNESEVKHLIKFIIDKYKLIDILVNNAGIAPGMTLENSSADDFDKIFNINVKGVFLVTKLVLPYMYEKNYGKIINTASQHAISGWPGLTLYTASKGAIISFTNFITLTWNSSGPGPLEEFKLFIALYTSSIFIKSNQINQKSKFILLTHNTAI